MMFICIIENEKSQIRIERIYCMVNSQPKAESIIEKFPKEIRHIIDKFPLDEIESSFEFLLNDKPNEYFESSFKNLKEHNPKPTYDFDSALDVSKIVPFSIQKQEDELMKKGNVYIYKISEQVFHEAITLSYLFILEYEHYHKMFVFHTDYNFDFYISKKAQNNQFSLDQLSDDGLKQMKEKFCFGTEVKNHIHHLYLGTLNNPNDIKLMRIHLDVYANQLTLDLFEDDNLSKNDLYEYIQVHQNMNFYFTRLVDMLCDRKFQSMFFENEKTMLKLKEFCFGQLGFSLALRK